MSVEVTKAQRQPPIPPVFLVNAALRLRRFFLRAADAVVPPYLALFDRFMGAGATMLVHTAAQLRIADILAAGPLRAAEIAERTGMRPDITERFMRALLSIGVFKQAEDGRFANNRTSSSMLTGTPSNIRGFAHFFGLDALLRAWSDLPNALRSGGPAFDRVHSRAVWDWMAADKEAREAFVEGMSSMTEEVAPAIAAACSFGEVSRVCDVGGGVGIVLAAALQRHAHLKGVLFEEESMLKEAPAHLSKKGVAERVDLVAGSFLDEVPRGADAYLLKTVLHNWDDDRALKILQNCRAAMSPGHKLFVSDFLVEEDTLTTLVPFMDLCGMMVFCNGRERTRNDMAGLFEKAGFRFDRVIPLPACQAVFEGVAVS